MVTVLTCVCKSKAELFAKCFLHDNEKHSKAQLTSSRHLSMNNPLFIPVATSTLLILHFGELASPVVLRTSSLQLTEHIYAA